MAQKNKPSFRTGKEGVGIYQETASSLAVLAQVGGLALGFYPEGGVGRHLKSLSGTEDLPSGLSLEQNGQFPFHDGHDFKLGSAKLIFSWFHNANR